MPRFEHVLNRLVILPPLFRAVLRTPTKRIGLTILGTWSVNDIKIIAVQLKCPPCLSSIKRFVGSKPLQASVISKNTDLMLHTLEIMSPLLKRPGIIIIIMFHLCMQPCGYGTTIYKVLEHQVPCLSFCLSYFPSCTLLRSTSFVSQFLSPACLLYLSSFKPKIVRK